MPISHSTQRFLALLICGGWVLACAPNARALLRFNDGREQIYVTAGASVTYDSNVFSSSNSQSDLLFGANAGLEYTRKAGIIGVTGRLNWDFGQFSEFSSEDFLNPSASLEFTKTTGRTTGALQFNARRDSRPDPTVGLRTDWWSYGVNLNFRYPVIERYAIGGGVGWSRTDYVDASALFSNMDSYTANTELFYSWRSDRDLIFGYRYRIGDASAGSTDVSHTVYGGVSGRIVRKLSGSLRAGVTTNTVSYPNNLPDGTGEAFFFTMAATLPLYSKLNFTVSVSRDYSITSTNFRTLANTFELTAQYAHNAKLTSFVTAILGYTDYLDGYGAGQAVVTSGFNGQDRQDLYYTIGYGLNYSLTPNINLGLSYYYTENWSTVSGFDYQRHTVGATVSTRW